MRSFNLQSKVIFTSLIFMLLAGCDGLVDKINEQLQASQGDLQAKRAISVSMGSLENLDRVDALLFLSQKDLKSTEALLKKTLNESAAKREEGSLRFESVKMSLSSQKLSVDTQFSTKIEGVNLIASAQLSSFVGATTNGLHWNLYLDGIKVDKIKGKSKITDAIARAIVNTVLKLTPVINAILDEAVNEDPEKSVLVSFDEQDLIDLNLGDERSDDLIFKEKSLKAAMATKAAGISITKKGIIVATKVEFISPEAYIPPVIKFPADGELIRLPKEDITKMIADYQDDLTKIIRAQSGNSADQLLSGKKSGFGVSKTAVAALFNHLMSQGPVSATIAVKESNTSSSPFTFTIKGRDCGKYVGSCEYKNTCANNGCEKESTRVVRRTCRVQCLISSGLFGVLIPGLCDEACDVTETFTEDIVSAHCDAFRLADTVHGGLLCKTASNIDKAICDVDAAGRLALCQTEQEVRRFYERNPVATLKTEIKTDISLDASISRASMAPSLTKLDIDIDLTGKGPVHASIDYDRHNYASAIIAPTLSLGTACVTDWKESVDINVSTELIQQKVSFNVKAVDLDDSLSLSFEQIGKITLGVDMKPSPLIALFGGKPQVTINCPLTAVAGLTLASGEAVLSSNDVKTFAPLLTGENYPFVLEDNSFDVEIPTMSLCKEDDVLCPKGMQSFKPKLTQFGIVYSN